MMRKQHVTQLMTQQDETSSLSQQLTPSVITAAELHQQHSIAQHSTAQQCTAQIKLTSQKVVASVLHCKPTAEAGQVLQLGDS